MNKKREIFNQALEQFHIKNDYEKAQQALIMARLWNPEKAEHIDNLIERCKVELAKAKSTYERSKAESVERGHSRGDIKHYGSQTKHTDCKANIKEPHQVESTIKAIDENKAFKTDIYHGYTKREKDDLRRATETSVKTDTGKSEHDTQTQYKDQSTLYRSKCKIHEDDYDFQELAEFSGGNFNSNKYGGNATKKIKICSGEGTSSGSVEFQTESQVQNISRQAIKDIVPNDTQYGIKSELCATKHLVPNAHGSTDKFVETGGKNSEYQTASLISDYRKVTDFSVTKDENIEIVLPKYEDEKIKEMLRMSFLLRAYILNIGIDTFSSKPHYRPDVDFGKVKSQIKRYVSDAQTYYFNRDIDSTDRILMKAEELYVEVAIVLPQASMSKRNESHSTKGKDNENDINTNEKYMNLQDGKPTNSGLNLDSFRNITSYKEFVKGDNIDVIKCLTLAEAALQANDLKKAERLIKKSERILPTKNAQQLLKKVEAAKIEAELAAKEAADREAAKIKAQEEAEAARLKAEKEAEAARIKALKEAEAARLKAEKEAEAARLKAEKEAEAAKLKAEREAVKQKTETEVTSKRFGHGISKKESEDKSSKNEVVNPKPDPKSEPTYCNNPGSLPSTTGPFTENVNEKYNQTNVTDKPAARECKHLAETAIKKEDFSKASTLLAKAKRLDPEINIDELDAKVKIGVISRSSTAAETIIETEDDIPAFQPTKDKKQNSKKCVEIGKKYLEMSDFIKAKIMLDKARNYYCSNNVTQLRKELDLRMKNASIAHQTRIPSPNHVSSTSETYFAQRPGDEFIPSHHCPNINDREIAEDNLKKARTALTMHKIDKAEELAITTLEHCPVRGKALMDDIERAKQNYEYNRVSRTNDQIPCSSSVLHTNYKRSNYLPDIENLITDPETKSECLNKEAVTEYIRKAQVAFDENNIEKCKSLITNASQIEPNNPLLLKLIAKVENEQERGKFASKECARKTAGYGSTSSILDESNKDAIRDCMKKANDAYADQDFDKSIRFFKKAMSINANESIQGFIERAQEAKEEQMKNKDMIKSDPTSSNIEDVSQTSDLLRIRNKEEAEKCGTLAANMFVDGDFDKAERLCKKALRMYPTDEIQNLLAKVRNQRDIKLMESESVTKEEQSTSDDKVVRDNVEKYIDLAKSAITQKNYYTAKNWLDAAEAIQPNKYISELKKQVDIDIDLQIKKPEQEQRNTEQSDLEKIEAEMFLKEARKCIENCDYGNARSFVIIACSLTNKIENVNGILQDLYKLKKEKENKPKKLNRSEASIFKAECYLDMGEKANVKGDFSLAEYYLKKSLDLKSSARAKKLLQEVAVNKSKLTEGSSSGTVKKFMKKAWNSLF